MNTLPSTNYLTGKGGTYSNGNALNRLNIVNGVRIQALCLFATQAGVVNFVTIL
ncbi:MAG: hypothetical protein U0175_33505 [Caldilineaceae bacterium]